MNNNSSGRTGVLIVEDLNVYIPMLVGWIGQTGYQIVGPAKNKEEAISLIKSNKSSLIVAFVDLMIPENKNRPKPIIQYGMDVISVLKHLGIPVVIASRYVPHDVLLDAIKSRFSFLYKDDMNEVMVRQALEQTVMGSVLYSQSVLAELERMIDDLKVKNPLDDQEWIILELRISGKSLMQIAEQTSFAYPTIRRKISDIFGKIGVSNTQEATRWYEKYANRFGRKNIAEGEAYPAQ